MVKAGLLSTGLSRKLC